MNPAAISEGTNLREDFSSKWVLFGEGIRKPQGGTHSPGWQGALLLWGQSHVSPAAPEGADFASLVTLVSRPGPFRAGG